MTRLVSRVYGEGLPEKSDFEKMKPIYHKGKIVKYRKRTKSQYLPQHSPKDNTMELRGKRVKNKVKQIRPVSKPAFVDDYANGINPEQFQFTHDQMRLDERQRQRAIERQEKSYFPK